LVEGQQDSRWSGDAIAHASLLMTLLEDTNIFTFFYVHIHLYNPKQKGKVLVTPRVLSRALFLLGLLLMLAADRLCGSESGWLGIKGSNSDMRRLEQKTFFWG